MLSTFFVPGARVVQGRGDTGLPPRRQEMQSRGMFNDQSRLFSSYVMLGEPTALSLVFLFYKMGMIIRTTLEGLLSG